MEILNNIFLDVYNPITKTYSAKLIISPSNNNKTKGGVGIEAFDSDKVIKEDDLSAADQNAAIFFNIDTLHSMREKIYALTGIPLFRQHVVYFTGESMHNLYYMSIFNDPVIVNIMSDLDNYDESLIGLPVYRNIFNNKDIIHLEVLDYSILMSKDITKIIVVDLFDILRQDSPKLIELFEQEYAIELFYYGFIYKYYPMLTYQIFMEIYRDKKDLSYIYPALSPNLTKLKEKYAAEQKVYANLIEKSKNAEAYIAKATNLQTYSVTRIVAATNVPLIDIRTLFDIMPLSDDNIYMVAIVEIGTDRFIIEKKHNLLFDDTIARPQLHKNQLFIYTNGGSRILITKEQCIVNITLEENDRLSHAAAKEHAVKIIYPYLSIVKKNASTVVKSGTLSSLQFRITSSNIVLIFPETLNTSVFMNLPGFLKQYEKTGLLSIKISKGGEHLLTFHSGTTIQNEKLTYKYLYETYDHDKVRLLSEKTVKIIQRASDIMFLLSDITDTEFIIMKMILDTIMYLYVSNSSNKQSVDVKNTKIIKRLKEIDPMLFDLKRHDPNSQVYSIKCQLDRQPTIYRENEIPNLPQNIKAKLVKFINFTDGSNVFYHCPNKTFPHLSFRPQVHPLGYCLPCCRQETTNKDATSVKIDNLCLQKHKLSKKEISSLQGDAESEHILSFGKFVPIGRKSVLHHMFILQILKEKNISKTNYLLIGVNQHVAGMSEVGLIFSMAFILNKSVIDFLKEIFRDIHKKLKLIDIADINKFDNIDEFVTLFIKTFVSSDVVINFNINIFDIVVPLVFLTYGICIVILSEMKVYLYKFIDLKIRMDTNTKYCFVHTHKNGTYPLCDYSEEKPSTIFDKSHLIIKNIYKKMYVSKIGGIITLDDIIKFASLNTDYKIENILVGTRGFAYAAILKIRSKLIYVPCAYSQYIGETSNKFPDINTLDRSEIHEFIKRLGRGFRITRNVIHKDKYIGVYYGKMLFYHRPMDKKDNEAANVLIPYDISDINKSIVKGIKTSFSNIGERLYNAYVYKIFLTEFANELIKTRNEELRSQLIAIFKSKTISKTSIYQLLIKYPKDYEYIIKLLHTFDPNTVIDKIRVNQFNFDNSLLDSLISMKMPDRIAKLNAIMKGHVYITQSVISMGSIYYSCVQGDLPHCKDKKMMISKENYEKCIDMLSKDLSVHIIRSTLSYMTLGRINPFIFTRRPHEDLLIMNI